VAALPLVSFPCDQVLHKMNYLFVFKLQSDYLKISKFLS